MNFGWEKYQVDRLEYWLQVQYEAIMVEAQGLNTITGMFELMLFKTLLRLNGVKQEDLEKDKVDRSAANHAGGTKTERIERPSKRSTVPARNQK